MNNPDLYPMPFEVYIDKLCQRYQKMPYEILEESLEWLNILGIIREEEEEVKKFPQANAEASQILKDRIK